jgi:riboflavin synthase
MFTGIVTDIGEIVFLADFERRRRLRIACDEIADTIAIGASIACAGVCLTAVGVERKNKTLVDFDIGAETLAVTTANDWRVGDRLNLERSLRLGDELGGHMVSGHVDGVATLLSRQNFDELSHFRLRAPSPLAPFIAKKGSVALDGTSLTVNEVDGDDFEVLLIPHTLKVTTWGARKAGDQVNIEVDQMARYAARLMQTRAALAPTG